MKFTPAQIERMALWAIVLILIVVVVFAQRRSRFTPSPGQPISMMDLQEYSGVTQDQKMKYQQELSAKMSELSTITDFVQYQNKLNEIMKTAFTFAPAAPPTEPVPPPAPSPTMVAGPPSPSMVAGLRPLPPPPAAPAPPPPSFM